MQFSLFNTNVLYQFLSNVLTKYLSFSSYIFSDKMLGSGCSDLDAQFADELFDTASEIADGLDRTTDDIEAEAGLVLTKQKLLHLLQEFILPMLPLRTRDLCNIHSALTLVDEHLNDIKDKIKEKDRLMKNVEKSLETQMLGLLKHHDFSSLRYVASCNYEFLKEVLNQLERDITLYNDIMLELETEISPLRNCTSESDKIKLTRLRYTREEKLKHMNETVIARETIKNVISRNHVEKKFLSRQTSVHPDNVVFMETACRFDRTSEQIKELADKLVNISIVRDAVMQAKEQVEKNGESRGPYMIDLRSKVNQKDSSDELSDLSKKVDGLLAAKPLGYKNKHKKFGKKIISKCQKLCNRFKSHSPYGLDRMSCGIAAANETLAPNFHPYGNKPNGAIRGICTEVIHHISGMTELLAEEILQKPSSDIEQSVLEDIYICYEKHVSRDVMAVLHELYEICFKQKCESLHRWISQKSLTQTLIARVDSCLSDVNSVTVTAKAASGDDVSQSAFETFENLMKAENEDMSIFSKLKYFTEAVQDVEKLAREKTKFVCTDDILDNVISLLKNLDSDTMLKTYSHINLINHLSPDFIEGNCHEYALISFYAAYQYLFDQQVLDTKPQKNDQTYLKVS